MTLINDAAYTWSSPEVLTEAEVWQARENGFFLTTTGSPDPDDGILLRNGEAIHLKAGVTVRYRSVSSKGALIVREIV